MLLERILPEYLHYMVSIVINPKGVYEQNFARIEEQALYCCPQVGRDVILGAPVDFMPEEDELTVELDEDDDFAGEFFTNEDAEVGEAGLQSNVEYEYQLIRRRGSSSRREDRPTMFYPLYIDEQERRVVRAGEPIPLEEAPDFERVDGLRPVWPINKKGQHGRWQVGAETMQELIDAGDIVLGAYNKTQDSWTVNRRVLRKVYRKLKTIWRRKSHDAGTYGTVLLGDLLGEERLFPFPKSVYAVRDCLAPVVRERPNALIVDFFAGSATTFHATCLLNAEDGGGRRSILVTNNEVSEKTAKDLNNNGYHRGDSEFEARGIFEQVARPRCEAVVTGHRPDETPIPGKHLDGRPFVEGFPEKVEFYRLDYLDPDEVDLGLQFEAILPALWMAAGGVGDREKPEDGQGYSMPAGSTYGVLFRESRFRQFREALEKRPDVTHVWLVTDSEEAYAEMRSALPGRLSVSMLYRDYLRNFRINTERNL